MTRRNTSKKKITKKPIPQQGRQRLQHTSSMTTITWEWVQALQLHEGKLLVHLTFCRMWLIMTDVSCTQMKMQLAGLQVLRMQQ